MWRPWTLSLIFGSIIAGCSPSNSEKPRSKVAERPVSSTPDEVDIEVTPEPTVVPSTSDSLPPEASDLEPDIDQEEESASHSPAPPAEAAPLFDEHEEEENRKHGDEREEKQGKEQEEDMAGRDFVALNGPLFEDWPQPDAAILISGEQLGYIEPCGCAGLENQKGGLARRHALIRSLEKKGWPLARIDLGGQIRRFGIQPEIKFRTAIGALSQIGYKAVAMGPQDLRLSAEQLLSVALNLPGGESPFVASNVEFSDFGDIFVEPFRIVASGDRRIGVAAILGETFQRSVNNPDLQFSPARDALDSLTKRMQEESDLLVLLAHATPDESRELARAFPQFRVVVTAGGAEEPPRLPETVEGTRTLLIEVGHKGMYVAVLGIYDQGQPSLRYQRVPLDGRFDDTPEMKTMMADYQSELRTLGLDGLGLIQSGKSLRPHSSGRNFRGSESCAECHTEAYAVWKNTPHSHATQTLIDLDPQRHFDPECLSCHVTGWEAQKYVPLSSGYVGLEETPNLRANGCENCHGPAKEHVLVELGELEATDEQIEQLRAELRIKLVDGEEEGKVVGKATQGCLQCHDLDNSPEFDFSTYWEEVAHHGKE